MHSSIDPRALIAAPHEPTDRATDRAVDSATNAATDRATDRATDQAADAALRDAAGSPAPSAPPSPCPPGATARATASAPSPAPAAAAPPSRLVPAIDLVAGLGSREVESRLRLGLRLHDTGQRILAFYLVEMAAHGLHSDWGYSSTPRYAEDRLGLDRRRTSELLSVGRTLLELPRIDAAFCEGHLPWSKVLLLARVATPKREVMWLERGLELSCKALEREVRARQPGDAPCRPGEELGLPAIRYRVDVNVDVLTHQMLELSKEKLSAECGEPVTDAELLAVLSELFLSTEADGSIPGRKRVPASLYRLVLRPAERQREADEVPAERQREADEHPAERQSEADEHPDERLTVDSDLGPVAVDAEALAAKGTSSSVQSACLRCDAECVSGGDTALDPKTPTALRHRILARDGYRCRCCGSRHRLQVHHIHFRADGGPTAARNLLTICARCHALVHARLLAIEGDANAGVRFADRHGRALNAGREPVPPPVLVALKHAALEGDGREERAPTAREGTPAPAPLTLETVPAAIDGAWWRRHAPHLHPRRGSGLELREGPAPSAGTVPHGAEPAGEPAGEPSGKPRCAADPVHGKVTTSAALAGLVGQDALERRLTAAAAGRRSLGRPFPHTLLEGPPGTGKTTIACGVAELVGARLQRVAGPLLADVRALVQVLAALDQDDVLLLDEIHAVPRPVLEVLYEALAERSVSLTLHAGVRTRCVTLTLPPFTLLATTTEGGDLPDALRSRFGLRETVGPYDVRDLGRLVEDRARAQGFRVHPDAARQFGSTARGSPREALRLLDRAVDAAAARGARYVDVDEAERILADLGYDRDGLLALDRRYLAVLRESDGPVSVGLLARVLGTSLRTLIRHVEPGLVERGLVRVTPRGRTAVRRHGLRPSAAPTPRREGPNICPDVRTNVRVAAAGGP